MGRLNITKKWLKSHERVNHFENDNKIKWKWTIKQYMEIFKHT